jgi:hypothetical protein
MAADKPHDHLTTAVLGVVEDASVRARGADAENQLREIADRLQEPPRLAIAGKLKSGKSTLLNALLGEELAPTDTGECTKIVTWYRYDDQPHALLHPAEGEPSRRPYRRGNGGLQVDLGGLAADQIDHLEIGWPTSRLRDITILDTPGISSIAAEVSARTQRVLAPSEDRQIPVADAVVYLLQHTHPSDIRFLESFHDDDLVHGTPMNAVGVLARADEIGACRLDAMEVADRIARSYQTDPRLHRLCPLIVPVNGLLGSAAASLREAEFATLTSIAAATAEELAALLLGVDRFTSRATGLAVAESERADLLHRLGLFGVRLCVELIRSGAVADSAGLCEELAERSGLNRLRSVLRRQFEARGRVLKARSAVAALRELLRAGECADAPALSARVEEIVAGAHEFTEVRLLAELRSGAIGMGEERLQALDRLLGGSGHDPRSRLALAEDAGGEDIRQAALDSLAAWQDVVEHPLSSRSEQLAAQAAVRTVEGLLSRPTA